jgi:hypothetical protein
MDPYLRVAPFNVLRDAVARRAAAILLVSLIGSSEAMAEETSEHILIRMEELCRKSDTCQNAFDQQLRTVWQARHCEKPPVIFPILAPCKTEPDVDRIRRKR